MTRDECLDIIETYLRRPEIYTIKGTDFEIYSFVTGYVSGLATYDKNDCIAAAWWDFKNWTKEKYSDGSFLSFDELLSSTSKSIYEMFLEFKSSLA